MDSPPAAADGAARPALGRRSSRLGGAVLIGVLAVLIAVVLVVFVFRGDDEPASTASGAEATPTASATPQVVSEVVMQGVGNKAQGLMRVFRRDQDGRLVFALAADKMPANTGKEVYAVWFTRKGGAPRNLGFSQTQVGKEGVFTTGGPQQGQERDFAKWLVDYDTVVVARASADSASAKQPGAVVLRGHAAGRPGVAPAAVRRPGELRRRTSTAAGWGSGLPSAGGVARNGRQLRLGGEVGRDRPRRGGTSSTPLYEAKSCHPAGWTRFGTYVMVNRVHPGRHASPLHPAAS